MRKFDVFGIDGGLYLVVQAEHLLELNTVVLVPLVRVDAVAGMTRLTVSVQVGDRAYRVLCHMPLTVGARRLRTLRPVHHLSSEEGQAVMDGLNTILWGF